MTWYHATDDSKRAILLIDADGQGGKSQYFTSLLSDAKGCLSGFVEFKANTADEYFMKRFPESEAANWPEHLIQKANSGHGLIVKIDDRECSLGLGGTLVGVGVSSNQTTRQRAACLAALVAASTYKRTWTEGLIKTWHPSMWEIIAFSREAEAVAAEVHQEHQDCDEREQREERELSPPADFQQQLSPMVVCPHCNGTGWIEEENWR